MVIGNLNLAGVAIRPYETNPELVVDTNAVLSTAIALERLQPVARQGRQIRQFGSLIELHELSPRHSLN